MKMLMYLVRNASGLLFIAMVASLLSGFTNASLIALINQSLSAPTSQLLHLGLTFAGLATAMLLTRILSQTLFMYLGQRAKAKLRSETVKRIAEASYPHIEKQGMSRPLSVLTQDLDTIVVLFVSLPNLVTYTAVIAGCLVYLGYLSVPILCFALLTIGLGSLGYLLIHGKAMQLLSSSRLREDTLLKQFKALFDGAKELKLNPLRSRRMVDGPLADTIEAVRVERTRGYILFAMASSWGSFLFFAFIGCVLYLLHLWFSIGTPVMTGYAMVFLYMIIPIEGLLSSLPTLGSARVALQRIQEVNHELPIEPTHRASTPPVLQQLELSGVTHQYLSEKDNKRFTLGPINLRFEPGEVVYLIGGNGSGKTTLAKILVGLYPPESGTIRLNGQLIEQIDREIYRQYFSVVFNDFYLFDDVSHQSQLDDNAITGMLRELQLEHKVKVSAGRLSTTDLSQGQRKRLALLLAWIEDRPFYLFDEWAADQDPAFRAVFYNQLLPSLRDRGKTVLAITHDDRYFPLADRIIKLESGQLSEDSRQHNA